MCWVGINREHSIIDQSRQLNQAASCVSASSQKFELGDISGTLTHYLTKNNDRSFKGRILYFFFFYFPRWDWEQFSCSYWWIRIGEKKQTVWGVNVGRCMTIVSVSNLELETENHHSRKFLSRLLARVLSLFLLFPRLFFSSCRLLPAKTA